MHKNARLTPAGRAVLVRRVVTEGQPVPRVAHAMGVSTRTGQKWLARWRTDGAAGLRDRSSRPHRMPQALRRTLRRQIEKRRRRRWSSLRIAQDLGVPISTVVTVQRRLGLNRLARLEPARPVVRYEMARPGELVHLDVKRLGRIGRVGHRIHGDRTRRVRGVGWEYLHVAIDDCTRLLYAELRPTQDRHAVAGFLTRAAAWFAHVGVARIARVMTDNAKAYGSHVFAGALAALGARHVRTRPYTPRTNGKAERVIQTLLREWAYANAYGNSIRRALALRPYVVYYNSQRRHTALAFRTPQQRLHAVNNLLVNNI